MRSPRSRNAAPSSPSEDDRCRAGGGVGGVATGDDAARRETCTVRIDGDLGNFWFHGALKVKLFDAARDDLPGVPRKMNLAPFLATQVLDTIPHAVDVTRHVDCPLVEALQRVAADA